MCTHKHISIDWISTVGKNIYANSLQFLDSNVIMNLCVTQRQQRTQSQLVWAWWEAAGLWQCSQH